VKELAHRLGTSPSLLCREFRAETGVTPATFFRRVQLARAKRLLVVTNRTTTQIGYAAAFQTRATFYRVFRQGVGCTPSAFRRRRRRHIIPRRC
jgi:AraC-like DNA-binding protein